MDLKFIGLITILLLFFGCEYPSLVRNEIIYFNDFEDNNLSEIDGGKINDFNNSSVLGFYNKDGFNLNLSKIGEHDYVVISFDLYIHGTWGGNKNGFEKDDQPDKWIMDLRPDMELYQNTDFIKFETTFSSSACFSNWCKRQSYPQSFPFENNPFSGASQIGLPRTCTGFWGGESVLYKIEKTFKHKGDALIIRFFDELYQPNAIDDFGISTEICDESWSMDNLKVRAISYK